MINSKVRGFKPYLMVLFLNAFVDLGHKIIIQNTIFKMYDGQTQVILIAVINSFILLPFVLLLTPAAYFSTRYSRVKVMRFSAWFAVLCTLMICICYFKGWYVAAFGMTLALATQSAIYSPAKYGYIRELVGTKGLGWANGYVQAMTIVAILSGTLVYSILFEWRYSTGELLTEVDIVQAMLPLGGLLVLSSMLELFFAYQLPEKEHGDVALSFDWERYRRGQLFVENIKALSANQTIIYSVLGLALFMGISQMMLATFPAFAKVRLNEMDTRVIQGILAASGVGVFVGAMVAGRLSRQAINQNLIPLGAIGMAIPLIMVPSLETRTGFLLAFIAVGFFGAWMMVPLNALVQYHSKPSMLGKTLAGMNWVQNISMVLFLIITIMTALYGFDSQMLFYFMGSIAGVGGMILLVKMRQRIIYKFLESLFRLRYSIRAEGHEFVPEKEGVLLLGNHISWIDWAIVELACPRSIHFVIDRAFYNNRFLGGFLRMFGAIPISPRGSKQALEHIRELLLEGEVVCLFPEGGISCDGVLAEFKPGFQRSVKGSGIKIVPFYAHGLWGSKFSRSSNTDSWLAFFKRRKVIVRFGSALLDDSEPEVVKKAVLALERTCISADTGS